MTYSLVDKDNKPTGISTLCRIGKVLPDGLYMPLASVLVKTPDEKYLLLKHHNSQWSTPFITVPSKVSPKKAILSQLYKDVGLLADENSVVHVIDVPFTASHYMVNVFYYEEFFPVVLFDKKKFVNIDFFSIEEILNGSHNVQPLTLGVFQQSKELLSEI